MVLIYARAIKWAYMVILQIWYIGVSGALIVPLFPLVAMDFPRKKKWIWQILLVCATWAVPFVRLTQSFCLRFAKHTFTFYTQATVFDMWHCDFYGPGVSTCGTKDFIGIFYYVCDYNLG